MIDLTTMSEDIKWPRKGDKLFKQSEEPFSPTWCSLEWLRSFNVDDSMYARAYREAGDRLIDDLGKGKDFSHPDMMFMPIAYLYRHSLELKMKHLISLGQQLELIGDVNQKKIAEVMTSHSLQSLWNLTLKILNAGWPDASDKEKEELKSAERMILELHSVDASGQTFKYRKDRKGEKTIERLPTAVQLTDLKDSIHKVYNMLDSCILGLAEWIAYRDDMMGDYI